MNYENQQGATNGQYVINLQASGFDFRINTKPKFTPLLLLSSTPKSLPSASPGVAYTSPQPVW